MDDVEAEATPAASRGTWRTQPFDVALGVRVRALRTEAGISLSALGAVADVSFQQMQKYEVGKDRVSASALFSFATALNVPVGSFCEGSSQRVPAESGALVGDKLSAKIVFLFQQIGDSGIRKHLIAPAAALAEGESVRLRDDGP